jgi:hypothetical protein
MARWLIALVVLLAACSPSQPDTGVRYQTYSYSCCAEIGGATATWHPGQRITLHWLAQPGSLTSESAAHAVTLQITLTGPFANVNQLKQAISSGSTQPGVRSIKASAPPLNDRSGGPATTELDLPADLAPGYYNLGYLQRIEGSSDEGATIVMIQ